MVQKKKGQDLFDLLVELTGLEEASLRIELSGIIHRLDLDAEHLTTEDLRRVVAQYLEDIESENHTEKPIAQTLAEA